MKMRPESETELAEMVKAARSPLCIHGGGTRPVGQVVAGEMLETSGVSGITLYEPGALTLVARAGTSIADIEVALDAEGQRLAFEPMDHRGLLGTQGVPTLGGVAAGNVSGPRRVQVGACRDFMLGVRFVDGQGRIVSNGGRVMKNVTGYDLVKLMGGSRGTLGVLTEVSLKVLPKPETTATLCIDLPAGGDAIAAMTQALGSPYDVSGAACFDGRVLIRVEGFERSVAYRSRKLREALVPFGTVTVEEDAATNAAIWRKIRDVEPLTSCAAVWKASVKPSDAREMVQHLTKVPGLQFLFDWGGGLIWIGASADCLQASAPGDVQGDGSLEGGRFVHALIQGKTEELGGHATLIKASDDMRRTVSVFQPLSSAVETLTKGIRAKFDPRGILNPGLMGP